MTRRFLLHVARNRDGSVMVEFGLLGPLMIGMLLAVLQVGIAMQNYNALRGISAEVARYGVVNYQTNNKLTDAQLQDYARSLGTHAPFQLSDGRLLVTVVDAPTQRVTGAKELTMTLTYRIPLIMPLFNFQLPEISYQRPIFLLNS